MTIEEVLRVRQLNQLLLTRKAPNPEQAVRSLGAVQAQDFRGARWAVIQRTQGMSGADFDAAFAEGRIVRTHLLRPTWHLVPREDLRWMLSLTAPRIIVAARYQWRRSGLEDGLLRRADRALVRALSGKQLTRAEVSTELIGAGIPVTDGRLPHILMHAELNALICSGAPRGKQQTYALLADRADGADPISKSEALALLARRFFSSHGPASLQDYRWWSGLSAAEAASGVDALRNELELTAVDGKEYWFVPSDVPRYKSVLHLLPNYDEYIVAYADRSPLFDAAHSKHLDSRQNPMMNHTVVLNGRVVGTWKLLPTKGGSPAVDVRLFVEFSNGEKALLDRTIECLARVSA